MPFTTLRAKETDAETVYLDHNATAPLAAELLPLIQEWLAAWGNPSSIHWAGRKPKQLIREARRALAQAVGCDPLELVFTSGGSEANNLAIKGVFDRFQISDAFTVESRNRYIFSDVEHPSVRRTAEVLRARGADVQFVPVSKEGRLDVDVYRSLLDEPTALVSIMYANNETGNLFPIRELVEMAHARGALFHTDAVQAFGKVPLNFRELGVDFATLSGHKFYALKGVGALYIRRGVSVESLVHGGGQERARRGGTENTLAICSLGAMAAKVGEIRNRAEGMRALRDAFESRVLAEIPGAVVTGAGSPRLPNTSSLILPGVDGETLLMNLDIRGFAVSTGAACSSGSPEPSPVLLAMGLSRQQAQSSLRVSLGWETTAREMERFSTVLREVVLHVRSFQAESWLKEAEHGAH